MKKTGISFLETPAVHYLTSDVNRKSLFFVMSSTSPVIRNSSCSGRSALDVPAYTSTSPGSTTNFISDGLYFTWLQSDAAKGPQFQHWSVDRWMYGAEIDLRHFIAGCCTGVFHLHGDGDSAIYWHFFCELQIREFKGGVAQAIAEGIQWRVGDDCSKAPPETSSPLMPR